ncbi:MAG: aminodeoxychorismate synthase component I [Gammaproteobacteria bacterium]|nr:aminodeoxychorismate synthase component I [Gammaproteobacteria bacterium]
MTIKTPWVVEIPYREPLEIFSFFAEKSGAVFLDSAKKSNDLGRYSYIAAEPFLTFQSKNGQIKLNNNATEGNPWEVLQLLLSLFKIDSLPGMPLLQGGVVGFFSYDASRHLEKLPDNTLDDYCFPDLMLGFYDVILSFDHDLQKAWIISTGFPEFTDDRRLRRAEEKIKSWQQRINSVSELGEISADFCSPDAIVSNFSREQYEKAVSSVIESILSGDIFEANIAQRFSASLPKSLSPFALYRRLRERNAAPFAAYLNFGDTILASASPERFLHLSDREVETRPIKGTSPRFQDADQDEASAKALLMSEKDRAENIMIVDLMRNDLSRVCEDHSVKVPQLCGLESFATVHHLVSVVKATLLPDYDAVDLLRATFPGGSITGAPKVRAMEIIDEIESHRRGPYCGSVGFISFSGDMDTSITIRTFAIKNNQLSFHVGGAIVADSDPAQEYQETLDKAAGMLAALLAGTPLQVQEN